MHDHGVLIWHQSCPVHASGCIPWRPADIWVFFSTLAFRFPSGRSFLALSFLKRPRHVFVKIFFGCLFECLPPCSVQQFSYIPRLLLLLGRPASLWAWPVYDCSYGLAVSWLGVCIHRPSVQRIVFVVFSGRLIGMSRYNLTSGFMLRQCQRAMASATHGTISGHNPPLCPSARIGESQAHCQALSG